MNFVKTFNKAFFITALGLLSVVSMSAKETKTKKLQILVNPDASSFIFSLNESNSSGLVTDPTAERPVGSSYLTNGLILPGGTIDKSQTSYLVDRHNHTITANDSIGTWWNSSNMVESVDFSNLDPLIGSTSELANWNLLLKKSCDGQANSIFSVGTTMVKVNSLDQTSFESLMAVVGGTGCNDKMNGNSYKAKVYTDEDGVQLIELEFEKEVEYNK